MSLVKAFKLPFLIFACLLSCAVFSEAPVIDESENYVPFDEPEVFERPLAHANTNYHNPEETRPLAHDNDYNTQDSASLLGKIQALQKELQELRGQLEIQAHDLKTLQEQQLAFYKDLDARIHPSAANSAPKEKEIGLPKAAEVKSGTNMPSSEPGYTTLKIKTAVNPTSRGNPAGEQLSYLAAYELVKQKQYDDGVLAMQAFVTQYPHGGYTANAQYWLGELYMVKKSYSQSIEHFKVVLQQFPSSNKAAPSLLKMGYALAASGQTMEARNRLEEVIKRYPNSNIAHLASTKLKSLNS